MLKEEKTLKNSQRRFKMLKQKKKNKIMKTKGRFVLLTLYGRSVIICAFCA